VLASISSQNLEIRTKLIKTQRLALEDARID